MDSKQNQEFLVDLDAFLMAETTSFDPFNFFDEIDLNEHGVAVATLVDENKQRKPHPEDGLLRQRKKNPLPSYGKGKDLETVLRALSAQNPPLSSSSTQNLPPPSSSTQNPKENLIGMMKRGWSAVSASSTKVIRRIRTREGKFSSLTSRICLCLTRNDGIATKTSCRYQAGAASSDFLVVRQSLVLKGFINVCCGGVRVIPQCTRPISPMLHNPLERITPGKLREQE